MKLDNTIGADASSHTQWPHNKETHNSDHHVTLIERHGTGPVETGEEDDHGEE
jgi:hypothetical protein